MSELPPLLSVRVEGGKIGPPVMSRRMYLIAQAVLSGAHIMMANEAVASTALAHPEWDMAEEHTWVEWEEIIG